MNLAGAGTIAFLMSDIEGSTRLWEKHPDQMGGWVARHDALGTETVLAHGGKVVKSRNEGDSLFCVFERASDGVRAAVAFQRALAEDAELAVVPLRVRMAVHIGEVFERDGDFYGPTVARCARIRGLAQGNEVLVSESASLQSEGFLPPEIRLAPAGSHRLKDLLRPENLAFAQWPGAPLPRALESLDAATPNNLPVQLTRFLGRSTDLRALADLLRDRRAVTLLGPGGVGKTRLSLACASEHHERFPGGVFWVDLSDVRDLGLVEGAIRMSLRARDGELLAAAIPPADSLLLLDNCEHLVEGVRPIVRSLLETSPRLHVLSTSREPLGVPGEGLYRVEPLSLPPDGFDGTGDQLLAFESAALWLDRARLRDARFELEPTEVGALATLLRRLDGLPLAIEQTAAYAGAFPLAEILRRLDRRFSLLRSPGHLATGRHGTMREVIAWSAEMLSEAQRNLFLRQSTFEGSWTIEMAEATLTDDALLEDDLFYLVQELIDKSLLIRDGSERFRTLETIRDFAREKLGEQAVPYRARIAEWFRIQVPQWTARDPDGLVQRVETELPNLRGAFRWWLERDPIEALRLANELRLVWTRSHLKEGATWYAAFDGVDLTGAPPDERIRGQNVNGVIHLFLTDYGTAATAFEMALVGAEEGSLERLKALNNLAITHWRVGRHADARKRFQECIDGYRARGEEVYVGLLLQNLGCVLVESGQATEALERLSESLAIAARHPNCPFEARARLNRCEALLDLGQPEEIPRELARCGQLLNRNRDLPAVALACLVAAELLQSLDHSEAGTWLGAYDRVTEDSGGGRVEELERRALRIEQALPTEGLRLRRTSARRTVEFHLGALGRFEIPPNSATI